MSNAVKEIQFFHADFVDLLTNFEFSNQLGWLFLLVGILLFLSLNVGAW